MKKDCKTCLRNDRNHHAEDCLYCMQSNRQLPEVIQYIIVGYTSDIDIKNNTAKIRYLMLDLDYSNINKSYICGWTDDIIVADKFDTREQAENIISRFKLENCITYGIEE